MLFLRRVDQTIALTKVSSSYKTGLVGGALVSPAKVLSGTHIGQVFVRKKRNIRGKA